MIGILIRGGNLDTDTHTGITPREQEDRDQGDASTSQGMAKMDSKPAEAGREVWNRFSLTARDRSNPADTLISVLYPPEL